MQDGKVDDDTSMNAHKVAKAEIADDVVEDDEGVFRQNAFEFDDLGGDVRVRVVVVNEGEVEVTRRALAKEGEGVRLEVRDVRALAYVAFRVDEARSVDLDGGQRLLWR